MIASPSNLFVDDETDYLVSLEGQLVASGLSTDSKITSAPEECLALVQNGRFATVVAHLNMKDDGLTLLEEVRKADADVECIAITAHEPTETQRQRANTQGVRIVKKEFLLDLLEHLKSPPATRQMEQRLKVLEGMHREWIEDLIGTLKEVPGYEKAIISSQNGPFTVAELIEDIQKLRPRGIEYIRLWRRTLGTLLQIRKRRTG
jgi:DNA-binding NtrC family response regulator